MKFSKSQFSAHRMSLFFCLLFDRLLLLSFIIIVFLLQHTSGESGLPMLPEHLSLSAVPVAAETELCALAPAPAPALHLWGPAQGGKGPSRALLACVHVASAVSTAVSHRGQGSSASAGDHNSQLLWSRCSLLCFARAWRTISSYSLHLTSLRI